MASGDASTDLLSTSWPVAVFHFLRVPSKLVETTCLPSGENAMSLTPCSCPERTISAAARSMGLSSIVDLSDSWPMTK